MENFAGRLAVVTVLAFAPLAVVTAATPAVSSAQCENGEWWDPTANVCRPLGVPAQPLACDNGWWWDPVSNACRPPLLAPSP